VLEDSTRIVYFIPLLYLVMRARSFILSSGVSPLFEVLRKGAVLLNVVASVAGAEEQEVGIVACKETGWRWQVGTNYIGKGNLVV